MTLLLLILCLQTVGESAAEPTADEVLRRVEETFRGVRDYTAQVTVRVDLERLKVPRMEAVLYYKEPNRVHVASTGFAMLPREAMEFSPGNLRERYEAEGMETVRSGDTLFHELTLRPRADRTKLRRAVLRVDAGTWLPDRLTIPLFDGRTIQARLSYTKVSGFWVPLGADVHFTSTDADTGSAAPAVELPMQRSGPPRRGSISIRYSGHQVNTGLPDSLFVRPGGG
jgi:outer membrane lipoprotein-sorting protein